ncbi:MAG: lamin tail domain-containing protein [Candidatus Levybacteria bacterium]|nr:lamin tail domain-containing protein [Candidatus Levybacteria bacterium]
MVFLFSNASIVTAGDLVINEFYSNGSNDWVELYNNSESASIDLLLYKLRDSSATNKIDLTGTLIPHTYVSFGWGNNLNNGGDIIKIVAKDDDTNVIDQVGYGDKGSDVSAPSVNQSAGRLPNGTGAFAILSTSSRDGDNNGSSIVHLPTETPTDVPTPTKTPTPTRTPTPVKSPTPTRTPTPIKTPTSIKSSAAPTKSPTPKPTSSSAQAFLVRNVTSLPQVTKQYPTAVLGVSAAELTLTPVSEKDDHEEEQEQSDGLSPFLLLPVAGITLIGGGVFYFLKKRKEASDTV